MTAGRMRKLRTTGRALFGLGSALLCAGWSFPPSEDVRPPAESELTGAPILEAARNPIEIAPSRKLHPQTIELDRSPALPDVLPSAGDALPKVLEDVAL